MKHLLTISALLISSLAMGQWPSLPYNPDDNADGLIGVADLQALLANYGSEFSSAVVSEDGESAIVYMGEMGYPQCKYSCDHLPGFWALPELEDLVPVWDEVYNSGPATITWLQPLEFHNNNFNSQYTTPKRFRYFYSGQQGYREDVTEASLQPWRCYCAAKQLPRVEYCMCTGDLNDGNEGDIKICADEKVSEGWYPVGGLGAANGSDGQAFWRWAE